MNETFTSLAGRGHRWSWRRRLVVVTVAALVLLLPGAALDADVDAPPEDVEVLGQFGDRTAFVGPLGRIYGPGNGWAVITGDTVAAICDGATPPETLGVTKQVADGRWRNEIPFGGIDRKMFLYEVEPGVDAFAFLGMTCAAVAQGGVAPEPVASGVGLLRAEQWNLEDPFWSFLGPQQPGRYRNSATSNDIFDGDGNRYRVVATANYEVFATGPPNFFKHDVVVIPRG